MDRRAVVASLLACWSAQDVEMTLAHCDDDMIYSLYVSEQTVPFGGEARGKEACRQVLHMMLEQFDYLRYEPEIVGVTDDVVRVQIRFRFHHRRTGENLDGSMRTRFTVNGGLVQRVDEFVDEALVAAFMRLTQHHEAKNEVTRPPELPPKGAKRRQRADSTRQDTEGCC